MRIASMIANERQIRYFKEDKETRKKYKNEMADRWNWTKRFTNYQASIYKKPWRIFNSIVGWKLRHLTLGHFHSYTRLFNEVLGGGIKTHLVKGFEKNKRPEGMKELIIRD